MLSEDTFREDKTSELNKLEAKTAIPVTHVNVRTSIVFLISKLIILDIIATAVALAYFGAVSYSLLSEEARLMIFSYNLGYFLTLGIAKVFLSLYVVLQWINEYYEIRPDKIIYRRGIIFRRVDVYDYAHIRSIGVHQGMLGRIFNFGSLSIYDRGVYKYYYLSYIHNPLKYFDLLKKLVPNADIEKEIVRDSIRDKETE